MNNCKQDSGSVAREHNVLNNRHETVWGVTGSISSMFLGIAKSFLLFLSKIGTLL